MSGIELNPELTAILRTLRGHEMALLSAGTSSADLAALLDGQFWETGGSGRHYGRPRNRHARARAAQRGRSGCRGGCADAQTPLPATRGGPLAVQLPTPAVRPVHAQSEHLAAHRPLLEIPLSPRNCRERSGRPGLRAESTGSAAHGKSRCPHRPRRSAGRWEDRGGCRILVLRAKRHAQHVRTREETAHAHGLT